MVMSVFLCVLLLCVGEVEATVPGSVVELVSRLVTGKAGPAAPAGTGASGAAAAAAAAASEGKKAAAARTAAAAGLTPLLPGLTALAASSSNERQYGEWLLLALESAGMSAGEDGALLFAGVVVRREVRAVYGNGNTHTLACTPGCCTVADVAIFIRHCGLRLCRHPSCCLTDRFFLC
jgi:hypothetical protein